MTTGNYDKRRLIEWLRAETARATGRRYQIRHPHCATRGAEHCEWCVEVAG